MTLEENKAFTRRFMEVVINEGNLDRAHEFLAPDFVDHAAPPGIPGTVAGFQQFFTMFRSAFPDLHYTVDDTVAEGDRVVDRTTAHGTMHGDFAGMPASHKHATWSEVH